MNIILSLQTKASQVSRLQFLPFQTLAWLLSYARNHRLFKNLVLSNELTKVELPP